MNGLHPFKKYYTQKMGAQQEYTPPPPPAKNPGVSQVKLRFFERTLIPFSSKMRLGGSI